MHDARDAVDALAEQAVRQRWDFLPTAGSRIGRHEYDGQLPDFSDERIRRRVEELRQSLARLSTLSDDADAAGRASTRLSRRLLELFLRR